MFSIIICREIKPSPFSVLSGTSMDIEETLGELKEINYTTWESETIVIISTAFAIASSIVTGVIFRIWPPTLNILLSLENGALAFYTVASAGIIIYIGLQSRKRALLNKLPSIDVIKLCHLVKQYSMHGQQGYSGNWHTTSAAFNQRAMESLFSQWVSQIIPAHDYFSYMLSERFIVTESITDKGSEKSLNALSISLSKKALKRIEIYEKSKHW